MKVFDMHCDTISAIYEQRQQGKQIELKENHLHLDVKKMQQGDYALQTFALFLDKAVEKDCFAAAKELLKVFKQELAKNQQEISQVFTYADIEKNQQQGKLSALLSLEEGAVFEHSPEQLQWFYEQGARIATFTWNHENALGYPNCFSKSMTELPWSYGETRGLKKAGFPSV